MKYLSICTLFATEGTERNSLDGHPSMTNTSEFTSTRTYFKIKK